MFEYKDDFLMGPVAADGETGADCFVCSIRNDAAEDYDELARLVGEGNKLESVDGDVDENDLPAWTDVTEADAPRLEFDLEDELTRAFEKPATADPVESLGPDFGTKALQDALASSESALPPISDEQPEPLLAAELTTGEPTAAREDEPVELTMGPPTDPEPQLAPVPPIPVSEPEVISFEDIEPLSETTSTDSGLSGMVSQEMEKALSEAEGGAPEPVHLNEPLAPEQKQADAPEATVVHEDSLEDFSLELARLMGEPDATTEITVEPEPVAAATVPPTQGDVVMPWETPEIVTSSAPVAEEEAVPIEPDATAFQASAMPSVADSQTHLPPAASLEVPSFTSESRVDEVLAQADAVEVAAVKDELDANLDQDLEAALSRELDAELEASGPEEDGGPTVIPPIYMPGAQMENRQTGRRMAVGIVAVALLGGSAALAWNFVSSDDTEPPQILASSEPVKVKPEESGGKVVPNQDQSVYEAVDGKKDDTPTQTALKDESEEPIAVAKAPAAAPKPDTETATIASNGGVKPESTDPQTTGGPIVPPRRVRTVVVRPDGTIVTQAPAAKPRTVAIDASATTPSPNEPKPVAVKTVTTAATPAADENALETAAATPEPETVAPKIALKPVAPEPAPKPADVAAKPAEPVAPKPTEAKPADPVKPEAAAAEPKVAEPASKPVEVAKVEPPKPKPAVQQQPESDTADPLAPARTSAYAVQVSSQTSPEAAQQSYRSLSRRFASIIGGKGVDYRKAKVKGRDYYRVRIPAESKQAAQRMCSQLKASGGDCFVTR